MELVKVKRAYVLKATRQATIANKETAKTQIDAHAPSIGVNGPTSYDIGGSISVENDKNDKRTVRGKFIHSDESRCISSAHRRVGTVISN